MNIGISPDTTRGRFGGRVIVFSGIAVSTAIVAFASFLLLAAGATQKELPPNTLWEIVHNVCVPGQSERHDPTPCLKVDWTSGIESGFAILRDPRGGTQFLLVPTTQISGIESPIIRGPHATNYFASAWEARTYINKALGVTLPRDDIGLAINSVVGRSQDQLHIHFSCIHAEVLEALRKNEGRMGNQWARLNVLLSGHHYMAMWIPGEHLSPSNPFRLLAEKLPNAAPDMGNRTLVVIGLTRAEGTKGFVILEDRINEQTGDLANGEELLDRSCRIATLGKKTHVGLSESESVN